MNETNPSSVNSVDGGPRHLGSGWISGVLAIVLGAAGFGAVLCFHFPSLLTMPELRSKYPVPLVRGVLHVVLVSSFLLGAISVCLFAEAEDSGKHRHRPDIAGRVARWFASADRR